MKSPSRIDDCTTGTWSTAAVHGISRASLLAHHNLGTIGLLCCLTFAIHNKLAGGSPGGQQLCMWSNVLPDGFLYGRQFARGSIQLAQVGKGGFPPLQLACQALHIRHACMQVHTCRFKVVSVPSRPPTPYSGLEDRQAGVPFLLLGRSRQYTPLCLENNNTCSFMCQSIQRCHVAGPL